MGDAASHHDLILTCDAASAHINRFRKTIEPLLNLNFQFKSPAVILTRELGCYCRFPLVLLHVACFIARLCQAHRTKRNHYAQNGRQTVVAGQQGLIASANHANLLLAHSFPR